MTTTNNSWEIAPRAAKYRAIGANEEEQRLLERFGLQEFYALSIARNGKQVAIVPLDHPDSRRIAQMIASAPLLAKMCEAMLPTIEMIVESDLVKPEIPGLRESIAIAKSVLGDIEK